MRNIPKRKILLASILLFSISASSDQILWTCTEPNDAITFTTCISSKGKKITVTSDDDLTILGRDFKATLEYLGTPDGGTVVGKDGTYYADIYVEGMSIKGNVNKDLIFIGNYLEAIFEKQDDSFDDDMKSYKGQFKYSEAGSLIWEGLGESTYFNGDEYIGEFRGNFPSGKGERLSNLIWEKGEYEYGKITNGIRKGLKGGQFEGQIYEGQFNSDGQKHGFGKYTWQDGTTHEGMFKGGFAEGLGKQIYPDGSYYEGIFEKDKWQGPGRTYGLEAGKIYLRSVGTFFDGRIVKGTLFLPDGKIDISGNFNKDLLLHGEGIVYLYEDDGTIEAVWSGEYKNGFLDGYGEYNSANGYKYKGEWKNGVISGLCEISYSSYVQTGFCNEDGLDGEGKHLDLEFGFEWVGPFKDGKRNGQGVTTYTETKAQYYMTFTDDAYVSEDFKELKEDLFINNKRIALVIGNNDYISGPLEYAVKDADGITQALEKSGFEVIKIQNATQENFLEALYEFKRKIILAGPRTDVLFFYAGHASQVRGINYLNPVDAVINRESQLETSSINMNRVFEVLNESIDGVKIAILDSCRNNPFVSSIRSSKQGLAQMSAPPGTIIAYSTAPGETAIDGSSKGFGIYTGSLIESINQPGLRIEEVFKETRKSVVSVTKGQQIPWDSSSLISDFYFIKEN